jgi:hypothetical protein
VEKSDPAAGCQFIPLPQGGAIVTCQKEVGTGQVDNANPYLGIGVVIFIIVAVVIGLTLTRSQRNP